MPNILADLTISKVASFGLKRDSVDVWFPSKVYPEFFAL